MNEIYARILADLIAFGVDLFWALIVLVIGLKLAKFLSKKIASSRLMKRIDPSIAGFLSNSSLLALRAVVIIAAALILGVPGSAFITVFGSAGVAIGLALQGSLSNLAGGLMLLFFRPFSVGDFIQTNGYDGTVKQISVFYTTIVTPDNKRIVLPNGTLTNSALVNVTAEPTRRLDVAFSVAYDSDAEQVRRILLDIAQSNALILQDPAPIAPMTQHGDNAIVFTLRVWVARENYFAVQCYLLESVKAAFDREGISIPYTQIDIHTKS